MFLIFLFFDIFQETIINIDKKVPDKNAIKSISQKSKKKLSKPSSEMVICYFVVTVDIAFSVCFLPLISKHQCFDFYIVWQNYMKLYK